MSARDDAGLGGDAGARGTTREIAAVFGRLGVLGFGGPVAVMAMMEEQAVRARRWLSVSEFGEIYAVCKLLPGPVATQMAIYLGRVRGGTWGGIVAGVSFILPSFLMVLGLSALYVGSGVVRGAESVLSGLQAAALAIILLSAWVLGRAYRSRWEAWGIAAVSMAIVFARPGLEPLVILAFGLVGVYRALRGGPGVASASSMVSRAKSLSWVVGSTGILGWLVSAMREAWAGGAGAVSAAGAADPSVLSKLFLMCFKAGFFVFGTGLAVVPVLEGDAVIRYGWLTHSQFMDGLAVGQVTPGPVVITSTFIGYLAAGLSGAVVASVGMFLPPFINVLILVPRIWKRFSGTRGAAGFSSYAIPAVIGGILGTTLKLGMFTLNGWQPIAVFVLALAASIWLKPPAWVLIPVAGVLSGALSLVG